ncbi:MAG: hypothetical protein C0490_11100 [Marivirga sp.]|nr:hypothetical protein [Marivirga sp.]
MISAKRFIDYYGIRKNKLRGVKMFCYFISVLSLIQCTKPNIEPVPKEDIPAEFTDPLNGLPDEGPVSFINPAVGQRSYYVLFEADFIRSNGSVDFRFKPDTLVFAITDKESEAWVVTEFLTKGSNSRLTPEDSYWGSWGDTLFLSYFQFESDSIHFYKDPEKLFVSFAFPREQKFPLQLVSDEYPKNPNGLPLFGGAGTRWMEFTLNYTVLGKTFDRLNMYFNYIEMTGDGHGFTHVYGPSDGLVRTAWVNAWTMDHATGWDLLPR